MKYWKTDDPENENRRSRIAKTETTETSLLLYALLDAGTNYTVRVRARSAIGTGAWSEVATARTGVKQRDKPILSLAVVEASGNDIDQITAGQTFRYRVKVRNLLNHHQSSGSDFTGWGTLGVRDPFAIDYIYGDGGKEGCHGRMLFLKDFTWTPSSYTAGYWEFDSADIPANAADIGPLRLRMGFECTPKYAGASHEVDTDGDGVNDTLVESGESDGAVTTTSDIFTLGSPDRACLSVEDSSGTVTRACQADEAGTRALKARFVSPPEHHDGSGRVKVRVAFSEAIDESPETVGEHGVKVEGGRVTSVRRVDNQPGGGAAARSAGRSSGGQEDGEQVWEFEIEPGSDDDLTMRIDAGRPCDEPGAICTADGRSLSEGIATTVEGPDPVPLTAELQGLPEAHDGEDSFRFRVAFSEDIGIGFRSMGDDSFTVDGGEVTRARRVEGRHDLWRITVEPDGEGDVTVTLPAGRECAVSGAICTRGGDRRQLTNTPTATVAGPVDESAPAVLTASFVQAPAEHDGSSPFKLRIAFSEGISIAFRRFRDQSLSAAGGSVTGANRVDGRKDLWEVTVKPGSLGDVTVTLEGGRACGTAGAVCTGDGRALSATISTTVLGPVALSVADARVREGTDETIDFAVSLSRASSGTVTVDYATADGTATAGSDYTAQQGTLTFAPGDTAKTVAVPVLDDAVDEGEETLTFRLANATGARIADGTATGTIVNSDPLQKMWLSRFGRTAASHVVDAVTGRLSAPSGGSLVTLGGQSVDLSAGLPAGTVGALRTLAGALGAERTAEDDEPLAGLAAWPAHRAGTWEQSETAGDATSRTLTGRELLLGSSFHLAAGGGKAGDPGFAAWGRVAVGGFDAEAPAEKGTVRLDGEVTTGVLGADAHWERWLAGVALSVSEGDGKFDQPGVDSGTIESTLTSVNPYVRYEVSERVSAWGLLGYGTGDMTMTQAATDERVETVTRTDLTMRLGAVGARVALLEVGEAGGIDLALRGDAFLVQMESAAAANTVETKADASRLRLVLEGSRAFALGEGAVLTPGLEVGLRHNGGDAETGAGVEIGGRIRYADAGSGLTVEASARTLIAHEDSGYREWGAGGSVRLDPGASGRCLSLSLAPVWGTPSSGVDRLWSARDAAGLAPGGEFEAKRGLESEIGYGFGAFGERGLVTPYACQSASKFDPLSACNIDPLSGTAEVVPVVNRGDPCGFV